MKSREQRIKDAAVELERMFPAIGSGYSAAEKVLEAADREPTWPTDESLRLAGGFYANDVPDEEHRQALREAMLADPIIKAAVACVRGRVERDNRYGADSERARDVLRRAVTEAGL